MSFNPAWSRLKKLYLIAPEKRPDQEGGFLGI
jgi:hypothetical protein